MSAAIRRWADYQRALTAFETVSRLLRHAEVETAPVKGIVLAKWLYRDVSERPLRDVDLIVPRSQFAHAVGQLEQAGFTTRYLSHELGEALLDVDGYPVELHAEIGRRDLTGLSTRAVIDRARVVSEGFGFPVNRIDDVDHALLLVANVIKDHFAAANPHQGEDLERLVGRLEPRLEELLERASAAGFSSGLYAVAEWMHRTHGSELFARLRDSMIPPQRPVQAALLRLASRWSALPAPCGLVIACNTNDRWSVRTRACLRLGRRGVLKAAGTRLP